jgi:hypothetical protein
MKKNFEKVKFTIKKIVIKERQHKKIIEIFSWMMIAAIFSIFSLLLLF